MEQHCYFGTFTNFLGNFGVEHGASSQKNTAQMKVLMGKPMFNHPMFTGEAYGKKGWATI